MRFIISIVIIVAISLAVFTVGMNLRGAPSVKTRIDTSTKDGQKAFRAYSKYPDSVQAVVLGKIVPKLEKATPKTLEKPILAIAYLVKRPSKQDKLVVSWLGAKPDIKKVRVVLDNTKSKAEFKIPPEQKNSNKAQAYSKVVYTGMFKIMPDSKADDIFKNIDTNKKSNKVKVELIANDGAISNMVNCLIARKGKIISKPNQNHDNSQNK